MPGPLLNQGIHHGRGVEWARARGERGKAILGGSVVRVCLVLWVAGLTLAYTAPAYGVRLTEAQTQNDRCYNCHGQRRITDLSPSERRSMVAPPQDPSVLDRLTESRPGLFTPPQALLDGPHAALACTDCHRDAADLPHAMALKPANCTDSCHSPAAAEYRRGIHAEAAAGGDTRAPSCADCHGGHDVYPSTDRRSKTYPLNVISTCGDCHSQHHEQTTNGRDEAQYMQSYMQSVHGQAVQKAGLVVAATCADCHEGHEVRPVADEASSINRKHVPETCGQCHQGIEEVYSQSIHGMKLAEGDPDAPVCSDCHAAHAITHASTPGFMRDIVSECGQCHERIGNGDKGKASLYETYRMSYHGQINELGMSRAARCSDCHGAHDILPNDDPMARLHADNLIGTCGSCHENANAKFVQFLPHADYRDGDNFPILHGVWLYFVILMSVTFVFYGVHSLLWLIRSLIERRRHTTRLAHHHAAAKGKAIKRFRKINRLNHALVAITFFGLTLTGMPLFFSDQGWAKALTVMLGGGYAAGIWHRIFAVILVMNFVIHFVGVYKRFRQHSARKLLTGPYTLMPRLKDVYDCLGMFRWFFTGRGKPAFDRWTYWEKFDYWAEIVGTFIIGGTGLMLWFPGLFSILIPGWGFNVATIVHGYEALLAVGFIFTIHFFNANLRPEKFPVDDVIFTGVVDEDELRHERPLEYHRLKQSGELESMRVDAPPKWQRKVRSIVLGITAMSIGLAMVTLIVLAGLGLI